MSYMKIKEVCEAVPVSRATLYRFIQEGLPYKTVGIRTKLFDPAEVKAFMDNRRNEVEGQLTVGKEYTNEQIIKIFNVGNQGGMRRSNSKNALILLSFHTGNTRLYEDYWENGVLYYTGMGMEGDQSLDSAQNKTLKDSISSSIIVYLFEMFTEQLYRYRGIVTLAGDPFYDEELDANGNLRKVIKFPLRLVNGDDILSEDYLRKNEIEKQKEVDGYDLKKLSARANAISKVEHRGNMRVTTTVYNRDPAIKRYALARANGTCELCGQKGPFEENGKFYVESHHILPLSEGGLDTIDNVCGLCPNCHTKMHHLGLPEDVAKIRANVEKDEALLQAKLADK